MKVRLLLVLLLAGMVTGSAHAIALTWNLGGLNNLPHDRYYTWGKTWTIPSGEYVTSASVTFYYIYNSAPEENDRLWLHLLESAPSGTYWGTDNQEYGSWFDSGAYSGEQILLDEFADLPQSYPERANVTYEFDANDLATLNSYFADGNFGLGFDPDCHYMNSGIKMRIETGLRPEPPAPPIPEPSTFALLGLGLAGALVAYRRRQARA